MAYKNSFKFDQILRRHGTNTCCICGTKFTQDNRCWNDSGCNEAGTIHLNGVCMRCSDVRQFPVASAEIVVRVSVAPVINEVADLVDRDPASVHEK